MEESLVPPGNAWRPRALLLTLPSFAALVVVMASDAHWVLSVPLGAVLACLTSFGLLDFAGCFDDRTPSATTLTLGQCWPPLRELGLALLFWLLALRAAVAGTLPHHALTAPLLVTTTSLFGVRALARLFARASPTRPWWQRAGTWLLLIGTLLYLPALGSYSLLDPWEPHYAEVTREMLARDDWLSLWWAQERWFFSKPVLDFWLQGLCFALLGVKFAPDQMLAATTQGYLPQPEWAVRLPGALLALAAAYALYRWVAAATSRRAGLLSGLALLTAPYWAMLSHQSMTDMPYVAPLTIALACFGLAQLREPEQLAPSVALVLQRRTLTLSAFHALFALVLVSGVPQLAYLLSRQVTLQIAAPPYGFRWHWDELFSGSGLGNCGLAGNEACHRVTPDNPLFQPVLGAAIFGSALIYLLILNRGERRLERLLYLATWYFTALSALAKGAPGLLLALGVVAAVIIARRDWAQLARIELGGLGLLLAAICLPWYVQSFMRHGAEFTDRLLFHDMFDRAFVHVHDTNAGADVSLRYYLWQLGYGLFPWTGLAGLGIGLALSAQPSPDEQPRSWTLTTQLTLWLALGFALFTLALTKFHHYALPCAPPLAVGAALLLDRAIGTQPLTLDRRTMVSLCGLGVAALLLVFGASCLRDGDWLGRVSLDGSPPSRHLLPGGVACAVGFGVIVLLARRASTHSADVASGDAELGLWGALSAPLLLLLARDFGSALGGGVPGSARLLHLVSYNYRRVWPTTLDFEAVQWGFGLSAALCSSLWLWRRLRSQLAVVQGALAVWFCAFTLWIYLPHVAPHYGQRELLLAYYRARRGPQEPIVAYQMNWKGENFYTGNRLPAFVTSGNKFKHWLKAQRLAGTRVVFFLTEHGRFSTLQSELGDDFRLTRLTDASLNNKFTLARAQVVAAP